jgi:hypothetical protein
MPEVCEANIASRLLAASPEYSLLTQARPQTRTQSGKHRVFGSIHS